MKPSDAIRNLRALYSKMKKVNHSDLEKFEDEDSFVFYHLDKIYEEGNKEK